MLACEGLISASSWGSSFCPTFSAVDGSALVGFEWYFAFFATISADRLVHFSWLSFVQLLFQLLYGLVCAKVVFAQCWQSNGVVSYKPTLTMILAKACSPLTLNGYVKILSTQI